MPQIFVSQIAAALFLFAFGSIPQHWIRDPSTES